MVPNKDHKIFFFQQTNKIVVDSPPKIMAKSDTVATVNYLTQADAHALVNFQPTNMGTRVRLPDNRTMDPEQVGHLTLPLPPSATQTCVFSALKNASLIPVGQVCDDGCQAICNKKPLQVLDSNKNMILKSKRKKPDGLWDIPLTPTSQPSQAANATFHTNNTNKYLAQLLHTSYFSPTPSTFIREIKIST